MDYRTGLGLRGHLALVGPLVLELHILDLQGPSLGIGGENRLEALIRDKGGLVDGKDVAVPHPQPGYRLLHQLLDLPK